MTQKGLISIDEIIDIICQIDHNFSVNSNSSYSSSAFRTKKKSTYELPYETFNQSYHKYIVSWFFPELHDLKNISTEKILRGLNDQDSRLIRMYLPNNIDLFKKIRDSGEPENEIEKAIFYDDVDNLQKIIAESRIDINNNIQPSIFNVFERSINKSYINFAAECGSIKCFKYLFLNHANVDELTYGFAIYGGNIEIIHVVDQHIQNGQSKKQASHPANNQNNNNNNGARRSWGSTYSSNNYNKDIKDLNSFFNLENLKNSINLAIVMHKYDIFDWMFEKQISSKLSVNSLRNLACIAAQNGNMHSFIHLIDNGLILNNSLSDSSDLVKYSAMFGFYRFTNLLFSLVDQSKIFSKVSQYVTIVFGNLSIFKLFYYENVGIAHIQFEMLLTIAIEHGYLNIIEYIIEELYDPEKNVIKSYNFLETAAQSKYPTVFNYLIGKFSFEDLKEKHGFTKANFNSLLNNACVSGNLDAVQKITEFLIKTSPKLNFTKQFISAGSYGHEEICQYFLDKNVELNVPEILNNYRLLASKIGKIILNFLNSVNPKTRQAFSNLYLNEAILKGNLSLFESLITKDSLDSQTLINAVKSHNIQIVQKILEFNSKPSFINQISQEGTALYIAVNNNDFVIVKYLLSIPGINPSLRNSNGITPLITSMNNFNYRIFDAILEFYGDEIQSETWQIKKAFNMIIRRPNSKNMMNSLYPFIDRLSQINCIDFNFYLKNQTLLLYACQINDKKLVEILLQAPKIDVNLYDLKTSNTPLIVAICQKNFEIANLLIEHPNLDINFKNNSYQTALIIAVKNKFERIIPYIINNEKFDPQESNLDYAFYISEGEIAKSLYTAKGLNVNYKLYQNTRSEYLFETCLKHAIKQKLYEKVEMIVSHPSFDAAESFADEVIFNQVFASHFSLLKKVLDATNNDVNLCLNGQSLFVYCVQNGNSDTLIEIMKDKDFNPSQKDFVHVFQNITSFYSKNRFKVPIDFIEEMIKYDEAHNHFINLQEPLSNGKTYYTSINPHVSNVTEVVQFYLDHNIDPNIPDSEGVYPLEYAITKESYPFVVTLLNSGKIDFDVKLNNGESYAFLVLSSSINEEILKEFIDRKLIDENQGKSIKTQKSAKGKTCKKGITSEIINDIALLTEGTEFPITRELIFSNLDLFERILDCYDHDLDTHYGLMDLASTFYHVVVEGQMNDPLNHNEDYRLSRLFINLNRYGRNDIDQEFIEDMILFTEGTEFPITKRLILRNIDLFQNIIMNYDFGMNDENNNKYQQIMNFAEEFYQNGIDNYDYY